jgi:hypothetical protein
LRERLQHSRADWQMPQPGASDGKDRIADCRRDYGCRRLAESDRHFRAVDIARARSLFRASGLALSRPGSSSRRAGIYRGLPGLVSA